jgi:hypothetical protein
MTLVASAVLLGSGCGLTPHAFRKYQPPAAAQRARTTSDVLPALVARLDDDDPVVRMAAHEDLRRRTGQDFGFVPWAPREERAAAVQRWRDWTASHARAEVFPVSSPNPPRRTRRQRNTAPPPARTTRRTDEKEVS